MSLEGDDEAANVDDRKCTGRELSLTTPPPYIWALYQDLCWLLLHLRRTAHVHQQHADM